MAKKINAAGGVVFKFENDSPLVLLIYRNGFWDIPKGKMEKGEDIQQCAVREVSEEVGVDLPRIVADLGTTMHSYTEKGREIEKTTYWYSMKLANELSAFTPQLDEGIEKVEWAELAEARAKVGFENLVVVLDRFKESLGQ